MMKQSKLNKNCSKFCNSLRNINTVMDYGI